MSHDRPRHRPRPPEPSAPRRGPSRRTRLADGRRGRRRRCEQERSGSPAPARRQPRGVMSGPARPASRRCPRRRARRDRGGARRGSGAFRPSTGPRPGAAAAGRPAPRASSPSSSASARQLGGRLGVADHRLGVGEQALGEATLLAAGRAARLEVRGPMAHGYVREPVGARQLPRRPEIAGNRQLGQDRPRLVDDEDRVGLGSRGHGLQPGRCAHHEGAERLGVVDGGEIDDEHARAEDRCPESWGRRTSRRDRPRRGDAARGPRPFRPARARPSSFPRPSPTRPAVEKRPDDVGQGRRAAPPRSRWALRRGAERELEGRVLAGRERAAQASGGKRPEQHEAVPRHGHAGRRRRTVERVHADRAAGRQAQRARAERPGERPVLAFRDRARQPVGRRRPAGAGRSSRARSCPRPIWPSTVTFGFVTAPAA